LHIQSKLLSRPVNRFFKKIFCGLDVISAHYPDLEKLLSPADHEKGVLVAGKIFLACLKD